MAYLDQENSIKAAQNGKPKLDLLRATALVMSRYAVDHALGDEVMDRIELAAMQDVDVQAIINVIEPKLRVHNVWVSKATVNDVTVQSWQKQSGKTAFLKELYQEWTKIKAVPLWGTPYASDPQHGHWQHSYHNPEPMQYEPLSQQDPVHYAQSPHIQFSKPPAKKGPWDDLDWGFPSAEELNHWFGYYDSFTEYPYTATIAAAKINMLKVQVKYGFAIASAQQSGKAWELEAACEKLFKYLIQL